MNSILLQEKMQNTFLNLHRKNAELNSVKIVYLSCNPSTQVRDIKIFVEAGLPAGKAGYKLVKIRPVDMFPHTYHIENVALLIKS